MYGNLEVEGLISLDFIDERGESTPMEASSSTETVFTSTKDNTLSLKIQVLKNPTV